MAWSTKWLEEQDELILGARAPLPAQRSQHDQEIFSATTISRFALTAGEGAGVPSIDGLVSGADRTSQDKP